jgi:alginate O-acetyltransferase complex protein AlgJ
MPPEQHNLSREEIAKRDIGHTDVAAPVKMLLAAVCLASVFGVAAVQCSLAMRGLPTPAGRGAESAPVAPASLEFARHFEGLPAAMAASRNRADTPLDRLLAPNRVLLDRLGAFQQTLDDRTWISAVSRSPVQAFLCRLGAGNEKAMLGRDGWLYYESAVTAVTGPRFLDGAVRLRRERAGVNADPVRAIVAFRDQLRERGIELVVVPAPSKVSIHPEGLASSRQKGPVLNPSFSDLLALLAEAGVTVYDPAPMLAARVGTGPQYLKTDTHWRPDAMRATAEGLAVFLTCERGLTVRKNPGSFVRQSSAVTNIGDIAAMLGLPAGQRLIAPEIVTVQPVLRADGSPWAPDPRAEILLLGDSFSNVYSLREMGWGGAAGFAEQLAFELQQPVDRIVRNDSGSYATREMLAHELARGADRLAGKKVVVWQFAARELAHGDWKPVNLRLGKAAQQAESIEEALLASANLVAVSTRPQRGAVYSDYVIKFVVEGLRDEKTGKPVGDGAAVVHALAMRNHAILPAANFMEGSSLRLTIKSWDGVRARYEGLRDGNLPDPTVELRMPHYWGEPVDGGTVWTRAPGGETPRVTAPAAGGTGFLAACGALAAEAIAAERGGIEGRDGWLFASSELRHLGAGPFWGTNAPAASRAGAAVSDPLPAVVDFDRQLKAMGISLLLVPVPPKAVVYPDKVSPGVALDERGLPPRADAHHRAFYRMLADEGVQVLDLTDDFITARREDAAEGPVYCVTDTHWSSRACALAARRIRERVAASWTNLPGAARTLEFRTAVAAKEVTGDLVELSGATNRPPERVRIHSVGVGSGMDPVQPDEGSPVILLADSHGLVFSAGGDMHATGGGLPDHLAMELGVAVDLVARRGSAATSVRIDLARRFIMDESVRSAKKVVVWCFAARDFTESGGWHKIPLRLKK